MSVDGLAKYTRAVLGESARVSVALAMMLTMVGYFTLKAPKRPFLTGGLEPTIEHGLFAFSAVVSGAIVRQCLAGSFEVSLMTAVVVMSDIAAIVAGVVNCMTIRPSLAFVEQ